MWSKMSRLISERNQLTVLSLAISSKVKPVISMINSLGRPLASILPAVFIKALISPFASPMASPSSLAPARRFASSRIVFSQVRLARIGIEIPHKRFLDWKI
jgi:hypothetical protein